MENVSTEKLDPPLVISELIVILHILFARVSGILNPVDHVISGDPESPSYLIVSEVPGHVHRDAGLHGGVDEDVGDALEPCDRVLKGGQSY